MHKSNTVDAVRRLSNGFGAVNITLGKTNVFECPEYDVVYVEVSSDDVVQLNEILSCLPHESDFAQYVPHVTIARVAKGTGRKYVGMKDVEGLSFDASQLVFTTVDKQRFYLSLTSANKSALGMSTAIGSDGGFAIQPEQPNSNGVLWRPCPECGSKNAVDPRISGVIVCVCGNRYPFEKRGQSQSVTKGWITLHPHGKDDDESYVHVFVDDAGKITAGPNGMTGKTIGQLHETHEMVRPGIHHNPKHPEPAATAPKTEALKRSKVAGEKFTHHMNEEKRLRELRKAGHGTEADAAAEDHHDEMSRHYMDAMSAYRRGDIEGGEGHERVAMDKQARFEQSQHVPKQSPKNPIEKPTSSEYTEPSKELSHAEISEPSGRTSNHTESGDSSVPPISGSGSAGDRGRPERETGHSGDVGGGTGSGSDTALPNGPSVLTARDELTRRPSQRRIDESLAKHLSPDQLHGAELAVESMEKRGGFLNADGTGIGKTRQILATGQTFANQGKKVLIVAPSEVLKPDWKKRTMVGSYAHDGATMRISPKLVKGEEGLAPGEIRMTTYGELGDIAKHVDKDTVVLFDEAHGLKNSSSQQGKAGMDIAGRAHSTMFATATPADKPEHLNYLMRAGVFHGMKKDTLFPLLGLVNRPFFNPHTGREQSKWEISPKTGKSGFVKRLGVLFDSMTSKGAMIKRELSLEGVGIKSHEMKLPQECHDRMAEAAKLIERESKANAGLTKANILQAQRRIQEPYKIPHAVEAAKDAIARGRQAIIFVSRVNESTVGKEEENAVSSVGTAGALKSALEAAGIRSISEIHGGNAGKGKAAKAMEDFQSGKNRVVIATVESGGTGVNLDDTKGDKPRTTIMMTPPLGATPYMQALGRQHRRSTRSKSEVINLYGDTPVEQWNRSIIDSKLSSLHAITGSKQHEDSDVHELTHLSGDEISDMAAHGHLERQQKNAERDAKELDELRRRLGMYEGSQGQPLNPTKTATQASTAIGTSAEPSNTAHHDYLLARGVNPSRVQNYKRYVNVSGNTFPHKDSIRSMGGEWDPNSKTWNVPVKNHDDPESTERALQKMPGLRMQHVWHDRSTKHAVPVEHGTSHTPQSTQQPKMSQESKQAIHAALRHLAGNDEDRAREINGVGFNKFDSDFGADLAAKHELTENQAQAAARMLTKYRGQLPEHLYQHVANPRNE